MTEDSALELFLICMAGVGILFLILNISERYEKTRFRIK